MEASKALGRYMFVPLPLWTTTRSLVQQWGITKPYMGTGTAMKSVLCGEAFNEIITREAGADMISRQPLDMLMTLFAKCVPESRRIFRGDSFGPLKMLHLNDYVIEKTFVYAMIVLSKLLQKDWCSHGVITVWPPEAPIDLTSGSLREWIVSEPGPASGSASSSAPGSVM